MLAATFASLGEGAHALCWLRLLEYELTLFAAF
jgi:hypothetical protein